MKTVAEIRRTNLDALIKDAGTMEALAQLVGSSSVYLSQIRTAAVDVKTGRPREMGTAMARRLEAATNKPSGWMDADHASPGHEFSQPVSRVTDPPSTLTLLITWERLMQAEELPPAFVIEVPDNALAPRITRGAKLAFERGVAPQPGNVVLVRDNQGLRYVRRYAQDRGTAWRAQATDEAYMTLESERDGLVVEAVMAWKAERDW